MTEDTTGQTPAVTDEMRRSCFTVARETWDRMRVACGPGTGVEYEMCAVDLIVGKVLDIVAAGLAGRTVVELPEPDTEIGDTAFWETAEVGVTLAGEHVIISDFGEHLDPAGARCRGVSLLAAAERADRIAAHRLAAESSGDGAP